MSDRKKIYAAGGLVQNERGELLMMFRRGKWDLPKGKLDPGESIEACAIREVMEETGLSEVQIISFLCTTEHQYFDQWLQEDVTKETHWYHMLAPGNQPLTPQTEEDIEKIEWTNEGMRKLYLEESYETVVRVINLKI